MLKFEVVGHWWLPEMEHRKLPGVLTFDPEVGGRLLLVGGVLTDVMDVAVSSNSEGVSTIEVTEKDSEVAGTYDRILGEGEGKLYTLDRGRQIRYKGSFWGEHYRQLIDIERIYAGHHFSAQQVASANEASVRLDGLDSWVARSGIDCRVAFTPGSAERYEVSARQLDDDAVSVDGAELRLRHRLGRPLLKGSGLSIPQAFHWSLAYPDMRPVNDIIDVISDLQDLVSIANESTASFEKVTLYHPDAFQLVPEKKGCATSGDIP